MICLFCSADAAFAFAEDPRGRYFRCARCEFVFSDPSRRLSGDEERRHYLSHDNRDAPAYRRFLEPAARAVAGDSARVLDYGCGPSPVLAKMLRERGLTVDAYDPFFAPIELDPPYDVVVSTEAAEHFFAPSDEFERLVSIVAPGGSIVIMTDFLRVSTASEFLDWHYRRDPTHVSFYSRECLRRWAGRANALVEFPEPRIAIFKR